MAHEACDLEEEAINKLFNHSANDSERQKPIRLSPF